MDRLPQMAMPLHPSCCLVRS